MTNTSGPTVIFVNPLGVVLAHYERQFESVVTAAGGEFIAFSVPEPSVSGQRRSAYLGRYLQLLWRARLAATKHCNARVVVAWPVLHYLDLVVARMIAGRSAWVVFHDPRPMVRTTGASKIALYLARTLVHRWQIIVHSDVARRHLIEDVGTRKHDSIPTVPLPISLSPGHQPLRTGEPIVRVLGQFKPDRDIDGLKMIAAQAGSSWKLEILGRGWPPIEGWHVESRFLSEVELDNALRTSAVVVIPYGRFYQSGMAVRCLEVGTPFVGPKESTLADFGPDVARRLVSDEIDWVTAIKLAMNEAPTTDRKAGQLVFERTIREYRQWLIPSASAHSFLAAS